jgi:hypothetical protein
MMGDYSVDEKDYKHFCHGRFSWSAVFVGVLVAIGLSFLFQLLGLGLGLAALKDKEGIMAVAITGLIGLFVATIITMFIAGWVSGSIGRIDGWPSRCRGMLYGFATWSLSLVIMVIFTSHVNLFVSSSYNSMLNRNPELAKAESTATSTATSSVSTRNTEASSSKGAASSDNAGEKAAKMLSVSFFLLFTLFLVGAISSILGGLCGHRPRHCDWKKEGR